MSKLVAKELEFVKEVKKKEEGDKDLRSQIMPILQEILSSGSVSGASTSVAPASGSTSLESITKKAIKKL